MNTAYRFAIALLLVAPASIALAQGKADSLDSCVTLNDGHKVVRNGGSQSFLLQDGQSYYRVAMQGNCGSLSFTPKLSIATDGEPGRLCPTGTKVETHRDTCKVAAVSNITEAEFEKARKRVR